MLFEETPSREVVSLQMEYHKSYPPILLFNEFVLRKTNFPVWHTYMITKRHNLNLAGANHKQNCILKVAEKNVMPEIHDCLANTECQKKASRRIVNDL